MQKRRKMSKKYRRMAINRSGSVRDKAIRWGAVIAGIVVIGVAAFFLLPRLNISLPVIPGAGESQNSSAASSEAVSSEGQLASSGQGIVSQPPASSQPKSRTDAVSIVAAGDNLLSNAICDLAQQKAGGSGYDFGFLYERVALQIQSADIALLNQQNVLSETYTQSGTRLYSAPVQLGDALADLDFDVINHANTHMLDKGTQGMKDTLDFWAGKEPIQVVGMYRNRQDLETIRVVEHNGITTAFLGITETTNGQTLPQGSVYGYIPASNTAVIKNQIEKARSLADVVVVNACWGNENEEEPSKKQLELSQNMVDWGADVILGYHPHLLPLTQLTRASDGAKCPVIYGLGSFLSTSSAAREALGGLLQITYSKDGSGKVALESVELVPVVSHYESGESNAAVYLLRDYTDELAQRHSAAQDSAYFTRDGLRGLVEEMIPKQYINFN